MHKGRALITFAAIFCTTPTTFPNFTAVGYTSQEFNLSTTTFPATRHHRYFNKQENVNVPAWMKIILGILLATGVISGVFGNTLVLLAVLRSKTLRKQSGTLMIINLAVTDLLMASLPMPILGVYFTFYWPEWIFGEALCRTTVFVTGVSGFVSVLTMFLIAFDRYFAIVQNKSMLKRRNVKIVLCLLWIISAIASTLKLKRRGITNHSFKNGNFKVCSKLGSEVFVDKSQKYSSLSMLLVGVFMQVALLLIYAQIGIFLSRVRNRRMGQDVQIQGVHRENRALKLMFSIVLTFYICWFPYVVVNFLRIFPVPSDSLYVDPTFMLIAYSLAMLNSSVNPLLYALVSENFRRAYRNILETATSQLSLFFRSGRDEIQISQ